MQKAKYYTRNKRNSFIPTKTVGVRAEVEFWDKVAVVAKEEGLARNGFIIKVVTEYMNERGS